MGEKDEMKENEEQTPEEEEETAGSEETSDAEETEHDAADSAEASEQDAEDAEEDASTSEEDEEDAEHVEAAGMPAEEAAEADEDADQPASDEPSEAEEEPEGHTEEDLAEETHSPAGVEPHDGAAHSADEPGTLAGVAAFFEHPKHLLAAATYARDSDYEEFDAYSPFPIHGMDDAMGLGRSWIPWVTFGAGSVGFILANLLQFGTMTFDWPMIIGGKPFAPWPSFVPVMFELTVLLAGVTTAAVMLKAAGCFKKPFIIDPRITDDRFVLWISADDTKFDEAEVLDFLEDLNPLEVRKIVKDA